MEKFFDTYCPECDEPVSARVADKVETLQVKGEPIEYVAQVLVCPDCGEDIGDSRIGQANIEAAYAKYCAKHGLATKDEIIQLRRSVGLSLREFSRYLGFGEQTAARYETGAIPDTLHSNTMRMAASVEGAKMLLDLNGESMSEKSIGLVESYIRRLETGEDPSHLWYAFLDGRKDKMTEVGKMVLEC